MGVEYGLGLGAPHLIRGANDLQVRAGYYLNLEAWRKYDQQIPAYQCCWELPAAPLANRSENAPGPSASDAVTRRTPRKLG